MRKRNADSRPKTTETELPRAAGENLVGLFDFRDSDVPGQICKHRSDDEGEVQATSGSGHLLHRQFKVHS